MSDLNVRYHGRSGVTGDVNASRVGFATNALRPQGYLKARLHEVERTRELLSTLHEVVISDHRPKVRDQEAFQNWLAEQDRLFLQNLKARSASAKEELERVEQRQAELDARRYERRKPFLAAKRRYADYVVNHTSELNWLFDPVVTVHPDEVFFEAFSVDESSFARVGVSREVMSDDGDVVFGTTNIDFSKALARHLERLRTYRDTTLSIGPGGVDVDIDGSVHREAKIPLPESWVRGFLQVQATMTMALTRVEMRPAELHGVLRALFRRKARKSPKAMRFVFEPGRRIRVVLEPWGTEFELQAKHHGPKDQIIRIWGRDRLKMLGRLLPVADTIQVDLAGFGLPSFWRVDLPEMNFTLGLSGWTDNDWTGQSAAEKGSADAARFELLTRRLDGTPEQLVQVEALRNVRVATAAEISSGTGLGLKLTRSAMSLLAQAGRATYDLRLGRYRHRDLFFDTFGLGDAKAVTRSQAVGGDTPAARLAKEIFEGDGVRIIMHRPTPADSPNPGYKLSGSVKPPHGAVVRPQLHVDADGQIISGKCTCAQFQSQGLTKGPCEHLLALRLAHMDRLH